MIGYNSKKKSNINIKPCRRDHENKHQNATSKISQIVTCKGLLLQHRETINMTYANLSNATSPMGLWGDDIQQQKEMDALPSRESRSMGRSALAASDCRTQPCRYGMVGRQTLRGHRAATRRMRQRRRTRMAGLCTDGHCEATRLSSGARERRGKAHGMVGCTCR